MEVILDLAADPNGFVAGIVGCADLRAPEIGDVLAARVEAGAGRFCGIRYATAWDASPDVRGAHTEAALFGGTATTTYRLPS